MTPGELGAALDADQGPPSVARLTELLATASEDERLACASLVRKRLSGLLDREAEASAQRFGAATDRERRALRNQARRLFRDRDGATALLGLAVLATERNPAQAARVLEMFNMDGREREATELVGLRPGPWREKFCEHAFSGPSYIPATMFDTRWRIVRALVRAGAVPKPAFPAYITFLPGALGTGRNAPRLPVRDALLADPGLLGDEVFDLFTVEGAGTALHWQDEFTENPGKYAVYRRVPAQPERTWRVALARLAAEGHLDRDRLLDSCLGAFARDFAASQLTWYLRFHAELAPDTDEIAARSASYLRLLAADTGTAVGLAQHAIARAVKAGRIDPAELIEASGPPLARPEKKHAAAQLRLLDAVARRFPDLAGRAAEAAAAAFEHRQADIQEQALGLIARHDAHVGPALRERLRAAATSLAPSLRPRAAAVLGVTDTGPRPGQDTDAGRECAAADGPAALEVPAARPRVASVTDLASAAAELIADPWDPMLTELVIDGMARFAADHASFAAALAPAAKRVGNDHSFPSLTAVPALRTLNWLLQPAAQADAMREEFQAVQERWSRSRQAGFPAIPAGRAQPPAGAAPFWDGWSRPGASPGALLGCRLWEIYARSRQRQARPLLAYPDTATGHVDPGRLVADVAALEDAGTEPWPADLTQAMLRLPRHIDGEGAREAGRLRSPSGRALAHVLSRGGVPDPLTSLTTTRDGEPRLLLHVDPGAPVTGDILPAVWELTGDVDGETGNWADSAELPTWPFILPSHREVAAAHALGAMSEVIEKKARFLVPDGRFVTALPDMQGPAGPGVNLALIYALSAHDSAHRAAGAEALIGFGRTGGLDGAALGRQLGDGRSILVGRVADSLRSAAADPAARLLTWQIASSAIPGLLRSGARDTHRVLSVAADLAAQVGAGVHIDGLADVAARSGTSRLVVEARRLHSLR
jgi:Family of unknown function (DUF6493)